MNGKEIPAELMEKAEVCRTADELIVLAKEKGIEVTAEQAEAYLADRDSKRLSEEELDQVAGGSKTETWGIIHAIGKVHHKIMGKSVYRELDFVPSKIAAYLKKHYGIDADLSSGFLCTGIGSSDNTYSRDGKSLTHQQVINIIKYGKP